MQEDFMRGLMKVLGLCNEGAGAISSALAVGREENFPGANRPNPAEAETIQDWEMLKWSEWDSDLRRRVLKATHKLSVDTSERLHDAASLKTDPEI